MAYGKDCSMTVKLTGAILIFLSCSSTGFLFAHAYRKEERYLSEFIKLLDYMICELQYRLTPLPQICIGASDMTYGVLEKVFRLLAQELQTQVSPNARCCLQIVLQEVLDIPTKLKAVLFDFSETLGCYDLDGQIQQLNRVKEEVIFLHGKMRQEGNECIRRYQTLGICAGIGLAILFI